MTPQRIQRKRTKGWRMPEGAVYVGRPTVWGNPFAVSGVHAGRQDGIVWEPSIAIAVVTRQDAVDAFRQYAIECGRFWLQDLCGHDLACWCPLEDAEGHRVPCHADVLLELANP